MRYKKILILLLPLLMFIAAYYAFKWRDNEKIEKIIVTGNITIFRNDILAAARLKDTVLNFDEVDIDLIQDRISHHPEVKKAYVTRELPSDLKIEIVERNPLAVVNSGTELLLIDDDLEIFPFKNHQKLYDLPVISGIRKNINPGDGIFNKDDLRLALFIVINSLKQSRTLYNSISEINLTDQGKIVVYLSEDSSPIYFPRRNDVTIADKFYQQEIKDKLNILSAYNLAGIHLKEKVSYVDMRFSNQVVVNTKN